MEDFSRNFEAMSMSSIVTDIAAPPPPPPPLELERWQTIAKGFHATNKRSFFSRQFSQENFYDTSMRSRGGGGCEPRFSRESSVTSEISVSSKSSTLSRIFSKKGRGRSRPQSTDMGGRSASIDSVNFGTLRFCKKPSWSTPATPTPSETYGTLLRGRGRERRTATTPSFKERIKHAFSQEKHRSGMSLSEDDSKILHQQQHSKPLHRIYLSAVRRLMSNESTPVLSRHSRESSITRYSGHNNDFCPSCRMPFDKAKKRRLVDTCGHERCYACMFRNENCPICIAPPGGSSPSKVQKSNSTIDSRPISIVSSRSSQIRSFSPLRPVLAPRANTIKYPQQPPNRYKPDLYYQRIAVKNDQHSHESGFQSATSLNSLDQQPQKDSPPGSTLTGSSGLENGLTLANSRKLSDSYGSLASSYIRSSVLRSLKDDHNSIKIHRNMPLDFIRQPYYTLKPLFFEVPSTSNESIFVGRQWLFREVSEHLTSDLPTNRGVVIFGHPGTGKTTIVLQLVENSCFGRSSEDGASSKCSSPINRAESLYRSEASLTLSVSSKPSVVNSMKALANQVVAYHFCQADNAPTCMVPEFIHSIAAQMSQSPHLTPYYQYLLSDPGLQGQLSLAGCVSDPRGALVKGILEPLNSLRRLGRLSGQTCIIIIDGLCEAELHRPDYGDTLASFLAKHLDEFPPWLKIVCTVRTSLQDITKMLPFQRISLDKTDVDERLNKDMCDYLSLRITRSPAILGNITPSHANKFEGNPQHRFTSFMLQASHGSFLYSKMILDLIERGYLVIKSSSFNVLPMTLSEIFMLEFNLKFPSTKAFEKVQSLLEVALASLIPMTAMELFNSMNALSTGPQLQWGEFLMRFSNLSGFLARRADDTVMFFHPTFREWLYKRRDIESQKFICDPRNGHAALALKMTRSESPLSPDRTLDLGHHILKAHIYKNWTLTPDSLPSRDLQALWVAQSTDDVSMALGSVRNVASPNTKVSRLLLLAGASPDAISEYLDGAPLMGVFANQGFADMVAILIEFGGNVNATNSSGKTPLMFAASQGHADIVRLLLQHGARVNLVDKEDKCSLVQAAQNGHLEVVNQLVSSDWLVDASHDLSLSEAAQQSAVAASRAGYDQILEFLLDMPEVTVNGVDTLSGDTCLVAAALSGQRGCCNILLRRGAKSSVTNLSDLPPLHAAVSGGHWGITEMLLKEGANIEQKDGSGRTPLLTAAAEGHSAVVEHLLSKKACKETPDNEGRSALSWSAMNGKVHATNCLIEHGSNISHADKKGCSPLDLAAANGHAEVVQLLLEKGANMEHVDIEGVRPLDRAIAEGHASTVTCFLRKGAKLGPATWTMANGKPEIMLILLNKLLDDGNTLYKREQFEDAAHRYIYAVRRIPDTFTGCEKETFTTLKVHLLLNLSRCRRKQGQFIDAAAKATEVLEFKPDCLEALHARARAHRESNNFREAVQDLNEALRLSPQNRDLHRMILRVKEEMSRTNYMNNNQQMMSIGAGLVDSIKYVDESASEV